MDGGQRFKIGSRWDATLKRHVRLQVAVCSCGHEFGIADNTNKPMAVSGMAERFRRAGWKVGSRRSHDLCPKCAAAGRGSAPSAPRPARPAELTPAQKRAAYCKIADVARAKPAPSPAPSPSSPSKEAAMPSDPGPGLNGLRANVVFVDELVADAPRQPTREDRRRIREALDAHYLTDRQCYAKAHSDASLAASLKLPRAWVTDEREAAYGPEGCEADSEHIARLAKLETAAEALETRGLELATEAERLKGEAAKLRAAWKARG